MTLAEKYRPKTLSGVVGQEKACKTLKLLQPYGGKAFYITGKTGTGKTTLALIIARSVTEHPDWITELDGQDLKLDTLNAWEQRTHSIMFGGFALIVNESHQMRTPVITRFLQILENLPSRATVIFTTTYKGASLFEGTRFDARPFASRCFQIGLEQRDFAAKAAEYVRGIATKENLNGKPLAKYLELAKTKRNSIRDMLMAVQKGDMLD